MQEDRRSKDFFRNSAAFERPMGKQAKQVKSKYYRCIEPMSTETTTGSETAAHVAHVYSQ